MTDESSNNLDPEGTVPLPAHSDFRSIAPERRPPAAPLGYVPSAGTLCATASWVLVLSVLAFLLARFGFRFALAISFVQAALIVGVLMRTLWDRRIYAVFLGLGALVVALLGSAAIADRSEYQPDLDRFGATPIDADRILQSD